jgi:hypothetical protein
MFEPIYYELAITWAAGWFGGIFWIGMEYDAPKPGDPTPWATLVQGAIGGAAAILVTRLATVHAEPMVHIAVAIVVGRFAASVFAPLLRRRAG